MEDRSIRVSLDKPVFVAPTGTEIFGIAEFAIVMQIKLTVVVVVVVVIQFNLPCNNHCKWKFLPLHKILSFS